MRTEVQEVVGDKNLTANIVSKLKYLDMVIKETLRLFPIGSVLLRETVDDLELGEHQVRLILSLVDKIQPRTTLWQTTFCEGKRFNMHQRRMSNGTLVVIYNVLSSRNWRYRKYHANAN